MMDEEWVTSSWKGDGDENVTIREPHEQQSPQWTAALPAPASRTAWLTTYLKFPDAGLGMLELMKVAGLTTSTCAHVEMWLGISSGALLLGETDLLLMGSIAACFDPSTSVINRQRVLHEFQRSAKTKPPVEALNEIYAKLDTLLTAGAFTQVDLVLDLVDSRDFQPEILLGFLTITLPWKGRLPARAGLLCRVRQHLVSLLGVNRADGVLRGL